MKIKIFTLIIVSVLATQLHAQSSTQKVLIEEHTGSWCGYCPDGHIKMDEVLAAYPNTTIGVMVHNSDGMDFSAGNTLSAFYVGGFPQATLNRQGDAISRSLWMSTTSSLLGAGPASVAVSFDSVLYNPTTRKLNVFLRASFTGNESGDLRFNGILVEDGVTGSGSNYDQTNYYNATAGHPMYGLGNPIIGYVHDKVARAYFGGAYGTSGSLPTTITSGEEFTKQYTYTLPASVDDSQISVIGMVSRYAGNTTADREIINAESTSTITIVNYNVGIDEETQAFNAVYPNPTSGIVNINPAVDGLRLVTVTNTLGEIVFSQEFNMVAGSPVMIDISNQAAGLYVIKLGNSSQRIIKN